MADKLRVPLGLPLRWGAHGAAQLARVRRADVIAAVRLWRRTARGLRGLLPDPPKEEPDA